MADDQWPRYEIGPQKHIHALGVVSLNYNLFEGALWLIFERYLGIDGPWFYERLNNSDRVAAMQQILHREANPNIQKMIIHLAKYFAVCTENRNNLMHAQHNFGARVAEHLIVNKKSNKNEPLTFSIRLDTLRQIADEIHAGTIFLVGIDKYLSSRAIHSDPETTNAVRESNPYREPPALPRMPKKLRPLGPLRT
ncbi:MAG TPA: hypothetical protein VK804_27000 [Bradyrhizobium sp.]|jgi:hypothetical protein|uniref:hypothetical protein n=1 Tax=Bradyrhizobium sp. TaxID=376 RepID=UPI002C741C95|nr:hypothetical protein [Bradyrhizobium sp.]HTB04131.1 hypothetical protein [Bradyrhizobium sp.]